MKPLIINMDSDCIVANMWGMLFQHTNNTFGTNYSEKDVIDYDIHKCGFPPNHAQFMQDCLNSDGLFRTFEPYPGAVEGLQMLQAAGHEITICSSYAWSSNSCANDKLTWFKQHVPFIPIKAILLGHPKHKIMCDVAVDDGPDKIVKYRKAQPWANLLSIKWPYHRGVESQWDFLADSCMDTKQAWQQLVHVITYIAERKRDTEFPYQGTRVDIPADAFGA